MVGYASGLCLAQPPANPPYEECELIQWTRL